MKIGLDLIYVFVYRLKVKKIILFVCLLVYMDNLNGSKLFCCSCEIIFKEMFMIKFF